MKRRNHSPLFIVRKCWVKRSKYATGIALLIGLTTFCACNEEQTVDELGVNQNLPALDLELFEQNLQEYVNWGDDSPIGWAYVISKDGHPVHAKAFGKARISVDSEQPFTVGKEINMASVSKFYTAIAAMQLLEANGLSIESLVSPHLPASWIKGPGVDQLRFKDLLRHESGLQSTNSNFSTTLSYEGIKQCIQTGVVNPKTPRNYLNVNFALFRILIPSLWNKLPNSPGTNLLSDQETQDAYIGYMQKFVFDKVGISNIRCTPEADARTTGTLYYNVNDEANNTNGLYYGDWKAMSGGGGYFMSVAEVAAVSAYFENTEALLSNELKDVMKANRLGMDRQFASEELHGEYYSKNGSISQNGQGVLTQIVHFPGNHVECSVVMNTQGVTFRNNASLRRLIVDAYNNAWVTP